MNKELYELTEVEFNELKEAGMLWEFFPDAPEFWHEIERQN